MGNFASKEGQSPAAGAHLDLLHSLPASPLPPKLQGTPQPLDPSSRKPEALKMGGGPGHVDEGGGQESLVAVENRIGDSLVDRKGDRRGDVSALKRLLLECRSSLDLSAVDDYDDDGVQGATDLLRCILLERGELVQEVQSLKETMEAERAEWLQFQSDLQVAVLVADRLHLEAQEELEKLLETQREKDLQLATAVQGQRDAERELESTRAELEETRQKLTDLEIELNQLRDRARVRTDRAMQRRTETVTDGREGEDGSGKEGESVSGEGPVAEEPEVEGKGGAKTSLQNIATAEKSRGDRTQTPSGVGVPEQSRSISRLPLPSSSVSTANGVSRPASAAASCSLSKNQSISKGKRTDAAALGQERGSAGKLEAEGPADKQDATPSDTSHKTSKAQDGFNLLLRRHGGSKRNTLLRWCQNRTQGYQNIDITNFSSSWTDGLAFCALYHTYLPALIPYSSLCPTHRRENLSLAFGTGESVGIPASLAVEEVLRRGGPDWQRVLGYVESIYRHFEM
ncbi:hypothetical protein GJAV_G00022570 [Gymnothorax javanicus]|nr:hypothetical protein GJAV_G00022570 [Gymnothorax javanicus]